MRTQYQLTNPMNTKEESHFFDWPQLLTLGRWVVVVAEGVTHV
jgi:hypothetical protein